MKGNDLTGLVFGRLTVVSFSHTNKRNKYWLCKCTCDNEVVVMGMNLNNRHVRSCGCLRKDNSGRPKGEIIIPDERSIYLAWKAMKQRCYNTKAINYHRYGGRGIIVCNEWINDFTAFKNYIGLRPSPKHSIDRINNNGNYEPGNIKWSTKKEQSNNTIIQYEKQCK